MKTNEIKSKLASILSADDGVLITEAHFDIDRTR